MQSVIAHNENQTFVTQNLKESLYALWSWDAGNDLSLRASTHSTGSMKWANFDDMGSNDDAENDVKLWEFYHTIVNPQHQKGEKKEEQAAAAEEEEEEEQKIRNKSILPNMFNKDSRIKNMIADNVEQLNPIKMFGGHKRPASASDATLSPEARSDFVGQAVEEALTRAKKTFTLKQSAKKYHAMEADETDTEKRNLEAPQSPGTDINAFKGQYSSVMDIAFTNPIAMAKLKAFKARNTPQTPRKTVKDTAEIPPIPEDALSPEVTRKSLSKFIGDNPATPTNATPTRRKSKTRKSKLQKALSVIHLLDSNEDDDGSDDRSVATTRSYAKRKKPKERRRSSSVGAVEDVEKMKFRKTKDKPKERRRSSSVGAVDDVQTIKTKKTREKPKERRRSSSVGAVEDVEKIKTKKTKDKDEKRSRSSSTGRLKKSSKLERAMSARNVEGERQSDDENDNVSVTSNTSKSPRTKRKTRRVPKLRKQKSEANVDESSSQRKSRKKDASKKLEVLNNRMKQAIGVEAQPESPTTSKSGGRRSLSLDERRARKRRSQQKLKGAFDKIVVDSALGEAIDATKTVGKSAIGATKTVGKGAMDVTMGVTKGAVDATKTVGKGAIDVTKTVGKGAMDVTKTVGKGALDVTKGVGKAVGVTKSTSSPVTRTE